MGNSRGIKQRGRQAPGRENKMTTETTTEALKDLHEMQDTLRKMGAKDEDIIKLWEIALETANKVINEK
jgi:hypothetical protein